jgi:hypothetical protein
VVKQPPDASREPRFVEAVEHAIANLPIGDVTEDLDHGKAVKLASGAIAFKTSAILRMLRDDWSEIDAEDVSRVLRSRGYSSGTQAIAGDRARVWSREHVAS